MKFLEKFRKQTKKIIAAEKYGFWSDWTKEQRRLYTSKDWKSFSKSRGYNEKEIKDFELWLKMKDEGESKGINMLKIIRDLTTQAALRNIKKDINKEIVKSSHIPEYRLGIINLEKNIRKLPSAKFGDCFPLKHQFVKGMYIREISVPKGQLIVTKIHKEAHPCFILKGDCSVLTESGPKRIKAPHYMITPAGTKRIVYVHEDTVWVTIHATKETNLEKIEDDVIAKNFDELDNTINTKQMKKVLQLREAK